MTGNGRKSLAFNYEFEYSNTIFRNLPQADKKRKQSRRLCFLLRKRQFFSRIGDILPGNTGTCAYFSFRLGEVKATIQATTTTAIPMP